MMQNQYCFHSYYLSRNNLELEYHLHGFYQVHDSFAGVIDFVTPRYIPSRVARREFFSSLQQTLVPTSCPLIKFLMQTGVLCEPQLQPICRRSSLLKILENQQLCFLHPRSFHRWEICPKSYFPALAQPRMMVLSCSYHSYILAVSGQV